MFDVEIRVEISRRATHAGPNHEPHDYECFIGCCEDNRAWICRSDTINLRRAFHVPQEVNSTDAEFFLHLHMHCHLEI